MASFSFGAGNARKLAAIPLYALGRLATLLIPRTDRWAFGSAVGIADGPARLHEIAREHGVDTVWIARTEAEAAQARAQGLRAVTRGSVRGFWATARAGVIVVSHGFGDVNRYAVGGAFTAQLWHGIPLKRIGLDSPATLRSRILPRSRAVRGLLAAMFRFSAAGIDVLPAASHLVRGRLESAFGLPDERIIVTGEPRVDVLSLGTLAHRRASARALVEETLGTLPRRVVVYAPTWRDGGTDPAIPTPQQWRAISRVLEDEDAVLLVRSHPLGAGDYAAAATSDRIQLLGSDVLPDVTPALAGIDVLITDYSSLAFDAGLVDVPVLYLAPDVEEYGRSRGFYGHYRDVSGSNPAASWDELVPELAAVLADDEVRGERIERSRELSGRVHAFRDGRNAERVYGEIERRRQRRRRKGTR